MQFNAGVTNTTTIVWCKRAHSHNELRTGYSIYVPSNLIPTSPAKDSLPFEVTNFENRSQVQDQVHGLGVIIRRKEVKGWAPTEWMNEVLFKF